MPSFARLARTGLVLALIASYPSASWAKKKKKAETPPPAEAPAEQAPQPLSGDKLAAAMPTSMSFNLELLDAGAEPRQALRLAPSVGTTQELTMVMDMNMDMKMGEMSQRMDTPPITFGMRATVDGVEPDGSFRVSTTWMGAKVSEGGDAPPELTAALQQGFAVLDGLQMTQRIDPTGRTLDATIVGGESPEVQAALQGLQDSMRQTQVYLPTEPVGVGARWRLTVHVVSNGIPVDATTIYTLRGVSGTVLDLGTEIAMVVDPSAVLASMPPGANVSFDRFDASGGGETRWDLSALFPTGTMAYEMHMAMSASEGGQSIPVTMDMGMKMEMR